MKVRFFKTSKRVNSTYIPVNYTEYECQLKDMCAITAPQITLSVLTDYNYCYIPKFGRYYFVSGCVIECAGVYTYTLAVDVLATYRSQILSQTTYVKRSASDYNVKLIDDTWLHDDTYTENVVTASNNNLDVNEGSYLITIVNGEADISANPSSSMYAMSKSGLTDFLSEMFDLDKYTNLTDLEATYFNPYQYITSCRWFPLNIDTFAGNLKKVKYGWYEAEGSTYVVNQYGRTLTWSIAVPDNGNWTGRSPEWTSHLLYIPFCGEVEIDPIFSGKTLTITQYIDFNTGGCNTVITDGDNKIVSSISGQAGADVAISQVSGNLDIPTSKGDFLSKGVEILGNAISRGKDNALSFGKNWWQSLKDIGGFFSGGGRSSLENWTQSFGTMLDAGQDFAKNIADGAKNQILNPTVSKSGADGARYTIMQRNKVVLYTRHYNRVVNATSYTGGMCHKILKLDTLSGYTQVGNGMFEISALDEEKAAIRQITETGFYIE